MAAGSVSAGVNGKMGMLNQTRQGVFRRILIVATWLANQIVQIGAAETVKVYEARFNHVNSNISGASAQFLYDLSTGLYPNRMLNQSNIQ